MTYFSESFLMLLVIAALLLIAISIGVLLTLLFKDIKTKKLW